MLGDVGDLFAVDEHLPAVVERLQIVRAGAQRRGGGANGLRESLSHGVLLIRKEYSYIM
jgi:hypothetical protein